MSQYITWGLVATVVVLLVALILVIRAYSRTLNRNIYLEGLREEDLKEVTCLRRRAWSFIFFLEALNGFMGDEEYRAVESKYCEILYRGGLIKVFTPPPVRHARSPRVADHYARLLDEEVNREHNVAA
jgi:hypothetical protein